MKGELEEIVMVATWPVGRGSGGGEQTWRLRITQATCLEIWWLALDLTTFSPQKAGDILDQSL